MKNERQTYSQLEQVFNKQVFLSVN